MKTSLIKISFAIALIGIFFLLILVNYLPIKYLEIKDINNNLLNKKITVSGKITNIKNYNNFQVISLQDSSGKIDITFNKILNLDKGDNLIATGRVREYKQYLQIQAEKIIINS